MATNKPHTVTIGGALGVAPTSVSTGISAASSGGSGGSGFAFSAASIGAQSPWANTNMQGKLTLDGENPDIMIGGKSMVSWMQKVEQRLSILEPKPQLLAKYEALQQAFDHYKTLEALLHGTEDDDKT